MGWVLFFPFYFPLVVEMGWWKCGGHSRILRYQSRKGQERPFGLNPLHVQLGSQGPKGTQDAQQSPTPTPDT